ncbi:GlxA family transcriptional regulator [Saccharopolyspora taberi]
MHRVGVLVLDGVIPFELGIPARILGKAEDDAGRPLYELITCTVDGAPVRTDAGFGVTVDHDARVLATVDTVIIPATHELGEMKEGRLPERIGRALAEIRPGTRMVSICTASYVLAAAGLLDGRPATTHWRSAEHFQRTYPKIRVDRDVLFVDDGDVLTSAGVAAGVDLCLHLVRRDHGSAVANRVARRSVVPPVRDGGQAQYIEHPVPDEASATTGPTRAWALERLHHRLSLPELAAHARMSVRTFTRRFQLEVGMAPGQWLTVQRVELARSLLETSDLPIDQIAQRSGFGTGNSLRQHLRTTLGVSPSAYRRTFAAK